MQFNWPWKKPICPFLVNQIKVCELLVKNRKKAYTYSILRKWPFTQKGSANKFCFIWICYMISKCLLWLAETGSHWFSQILTFTKLSCYLLNWAYWGQGQVNITFVTAARQLKYFGNYITFWDKTSMMCIEFMLLYISQVSFNQDFRNKFLQHFWTFISSPEPKFWRSLIRILKW